MNIHAKQRPNVGLLALAISAFAIGVSEFLVVGVLPAIADDLATSLESAGHLVSLYALALAVGTPFLSVAVSRFARKRVLLILLAVFLAGNLLSALSTGYGLLLFGRIVTALAHGTFFGIGATVASKLAPQGQASRAIAVMLAGLTLAMVIGVPLGSFLGNQAGWRLPFFAVAALAALGMVALQMWLPSNVPAGAHGKVRTQLAALGNPEILVMMLITILGFGGSFAAFTFITPILTGITGFSLGTASILLIVFGTATFAGNLVGGQLAVRFGWQRAVAVILVLLAVADVILALTLTSQLVTVVMLFVWGSLAFSLSPCFQAGMLDTAERFTPQALEVASGLNISAFNIGISLGAFLGGFLVSQNMMESTPWIGVAMSVLALAPLAWLSKKETAVRSQAFDADIRGNKASTRVRSGKPGFLQKFIHEEDSDPQIRR